MSRQLQTVLTIRRRAEEAAVLDLAVKRSLAVEARYAADTAEQEARRPVTGYDGGTFVTSHDLAERRQKAHHLALELVAVADANAASAMSVYSAARQQVEMIERLLEKKAVLAQERALHLEQSLLDDASAALWARSHA